MKPIEFHPDAAQEASDAVDYYDGLSPGLGDDFRVDLEDALLRIKQSPAQFVVASKSLRRCSLDRFPYSVYYSELEERIWVAAVAHHSRRPGYWSRRKPT